jgi:hypothetical protein
MGRRLLLLLALGGCSVEGARQVGDTCLNDRECAPPLRCELTAGGSQRCVAPVRIDAAVPDVPAAPDLPPVTDVQRPDDVDDGGNTPRD